MTKHHKLIASHFFNILESVDDGIYVTDKNGTTLYVNSMYTKITGLKSEDLLGQNVIDLKVKGIFDTILNPTIVKTKKPETNVQTLQDGKRVVLRGFPVFDEGKELIFVFTLVRDVTFMEQMRVQHFQQKNLLSLYRNRVEFLSAQDSDNIVPLPDKLFQLIKQAASNENTILLQGEPGVGKDWVARQIHNYSVRKNEIFMKVDCRNLSQNDIEFELYGYVPEPIDAFTRADTDGKLGYFEIANKGTVFLNEIDALPLAMQEKLLRVVKDQEVIRIGSVSQKIDVSIIAASNISLENSIQEGNFNPDLYGILREAVIDIPNLNETPEMIPVLVNHFIEQYGSKYNKKVMCSDEVMTNLTAYQWPGNTQELKNTIQNLILTCEGGQILPQNLPPSMLGRKVQILSE